MCLQPWSIPADCVHQCIRNADYKARTLQGSGGISVTWVSLNFVFGEDTLLKNEGNLQPAWPRTAIKQHFPSS